MSKSDKILILRFSALGDVAMTVPVVASFLKAYPDKKVVVVSRAFASKLFTPISGVTFVAIDPNGKHKGIKGLWLLFKTLRSMGPFDFVADLHNVLRTQFLTALFRVAGTKVIQIDKGRKEKKALVRKKNKQFVQLKSTFTRYHEVFQKAGFHFSLDGFDGREIYLSKEMVPTHAAFTIAGHHIGIAPFAGHIWKTWPIEKMKELVEKLDTQNHQIYLFGGRGKEQKTLESWASEMENVHNLAGQLTMDDELKAMSSLDVMVSMDSANMHLARLVNTPVVSLWGATHPYAGFYGWKMPAEWAVQIDLDCRPSSIYGNKPCHRGDFSCMEKITPEMVMSKIDSIINP